MKTSYIFLILTAAVLVWGCGSTRELTDNDLSSKIENVIKDSRFNNAHIGILIKSLNSGETIFERNAGKLFMPASNQKILTTAAALSKLGENFKFETKFCYSGTITDSVLSGDIIVFGYGDPTLYTRFYTSPDEVFRSFAAKLKEKGIKSVSGDIIGDDNAFDDDTYGNGWSFDGLDAWYSAEVSALQFNENYIDLTVTSTADSASRCVITPNIVSSYFNLIDSVKTGNYDRDFISVSRKFGTNDILVSGRIKPGSVQYKSPSIYNPTKFYVTVLREVLIREGISVEGKAVDCDELENWYHSPDEFYPLETVYSPPLIEILKGLMKRSQNMYAETMVKTLGYQFYQTGTYKNGIKVIDEYLKSIGIEPDSYVYTDGSGLSRYNYVAPSALVKVLEVMDKSSNGNLWHSLFPIAGVDGTLSGRMKNTKAENNAHAKTGTISNVRGLSGYVTGMSGEKFVFSMLINAHTQPTSVTDELTDKIVNILAEY